MDKFYLDKVFPQTDQLFTFKYKSYEQSKQDCIFVLDTNVLFVPFQTSKKGLADIQKILKRLKKSNRLYIPARVAREFAKNRGENLATIFRKSEEATDRVNKINIDLGNFPILSENQYYIAAKDIEKEIIERVSNLREQLKQLKEDVKNWNWDDPVSEIYRSVLTKEIIVDTTKLSTDIESDLAFRIEHQIAPGFKDSKKPDGGIGDLIIWHTILELGKKKKKNITFVSNEKKTDWFHSEYRTNLYPKFELFDEFRRESDGNSINIISFEEFLISQDAQEETITEIRELLAPTGFKIVDKSTFVNALKDSVIKAQSKNGFVSAKYLVERVLRNQGYDIGNSWEIYHELVGEEIVENYQYIDKEGIYPPVNAIRFKISV